MIWAAAARGDAGRRMLARRPGAGPAARPLRALADELVDAAARAAPAAPAPRGHAPAVASWRPARRATSERLAADLAVLGRTPVRHALDKLGYAVLFLALALVPAVLFPLLDVGVPPCHDGHRRAAVRRRRVVLPRRRGAVPRPAPLAGVVAGAHGLRRHRRHLAGRRRRRRGRADGRRRRRGRTAVRRAATPPCAPPRPAASKLWHALDELGERGDIRPLRELASAVDLAAESGSRIRETLLAKANALRVRQLTEAEADAQKASETMGIAPALMAIAAVVLIGYPAVARFLSG